MTKQSTRRIGFWVMMAAIFTLLFSPLSGFTCLPSATLAVSSHSHASASDAHCHQSEEKEQKCDGHEKPCESSHHSPKDKAPTSQTCCCSHGDFSFQHAAVVTAPKISLEFSDVTPIVFFAPRVVTTRIHFATANSPPAELLFSQVPSRAPPVQQNELNTF